MGKCQVSTCDRKVKTKGYCNMHYKFKWRTGLDPELHVYGVQRKRNGDYAGIELTPSDGIPWPATLTL